VQAEFLPADSPFCFFAFFAEKMKLTKEVIQHLTMLQQQHNESNTNIHKLNQLHESILAEQEQTLQKDPVSDGLATRTAASGESITVPKFDPNQEYRLHSLDFEDLKKRYRDCARGLEHEEK
jgi:hypothetical protein